MNNNRKVIIFFMIGLLVIVAAAVNKELKSNEKIAWFIGPYKDAIIAWDFKDGTARISFYKGKDEDGMSVFTNTYFSIEGKEITEAEYEKLSRKEPLEKTGIPNLAEYDMIFEPHEGYAVAVKNNGSLINQKHYFLNENGEAAFETEFDFAYDFSDGLAVVQFADDQGKWSVIDLNGEIILQTPYRILPFSERLAPFFNRNKQKWGYININGDKVIPEMFEDARCFRDGLAAVKSNEGWGYIKNPLI